MIRRWSAVWCQFIHTPSAPALFVVLLLLLYTCGGRFRPAVRDREYNVSVSTAASAPQPDRTLIDTAQSNAQKGSHAYCYALHQPHYHDCCVG